MLGVLADVVDRVVRRTIVRTGKLRSTRRRHLEIDAPSFAIEPDIAYFPSGSSVRGQR